MPVSADTVVGNGVIIHHENLVNIYGARIGAQTRIGAFVEIQKGAVIGARCKVQSHSFICEGVTIEDEVFVGHGVFFTNDRYPHATNPDGSMKGDKDWKCIPTRVCRGASIGSGSVILPGLTIGEGAMVGGGSVVTRDVPAHALVAGNPARVIGDARKLADR
jgi:acetyltransferase-like isoleucine patch superfamily enzyme